MGFASFALYLAVNLPLSALLLTLIWLADRYEREPWSILLLCAGWGALPAILLSCVLETAVQVPLQALAGPQAGALLGTVFLAPPVEEAAKAVALLFAILLYQKEFDDVLDGMVYGAAVGVGFSFVEDLFYFIGALSQGGVELGALVFGVRNVGFMLNHSLFTALTGVGFGLGRVFHRNPLAVLFFPPMGLAAAIGLHALHNLLASLDLPGVAAALFVHWVGGVGLLMVVPVLWAVERRWIVNRLRNEVREERIPLRALAVLPFSGYRGPHIPRGAVQPLRRALVELAFGRKRREEGWGSKGEEDLDRLRSEVRRLCPDP
ncbi:MAG: PrsW family intramembrane metalloprotease [Acidobacteriota bacterium]